jgi:hypothetical protein
MGTLRKIKNNKYAVFGEQMVLGEMPLFKLKPFATIRPFSFKMALSCLDG